MDVAYGENLQRPRRLILEVSEKYGSYTTCSESCGIGYLPESAMRTKEEWLAWIERFSDELTGRELREAKEYVNAPFTEPDSWTGFRERYASTGDPWLKE